MTAEDKQLKEEARLAFYRARAERKLSQGEFAAELKQVLGRSVKVNQVSMWETGERALYAHTLLAAARVGGRPLSFFLREPALTRAIDEALDRPHRG